MTYVTFQRAPTGFIPQQDQGRLIANIQLPDSASLQRTEAVVAKIQKIARGDPDDREHYPGIPGIAHTVAFAGSSFLLQANSSNFASMFIVLAPFDERQRPDLRDTAIMNNFDNKAYELRRYSLRNRLRTCPTSTGPRTVRRYRRRNTWQEGWRFLHQTKTQAERSGSGTHSCGTTEEMGSSKEGDEKAAKEATAPAKKIAKRRKLSAKTRKAIADAQRKRWAKVKAEKAAKKVPAKKAARKAPAKKATAKPKKAASKKVLRQRRRRLRRRRPPLPQRKPLHSKLGYTRQESRLALSRTSIAIEFCQTSQHDRRTPKKTESHSRFGKGNPPLGTATG